MLNTAVSSQAAPPRCHARSRHPRFFLRLKHEQSNVCVVCVKSGCAKNFTPQHLSERQNLLTRYRQTQRKPARVNDTAGQSEHTLTLSSHAYIYRYTVILYQVATSERRMQHERTHTALTELRAASEVPATWLHHPAATVGARRMHAAHQAPPRKLSS